jgi:hypothetical protein
MRGNMTKVFQGNFGKDYGKDLPEQHVKAVDEVQTKFGEIADVVGRVTPQGYIQQLLLARLWEINSLVRTSLTSGPALAEFDQITRVA